MKNQEYLSNERYAEIFTKNEGYFINRGIIESPDVFHFLCDEINPEDREDYDEEIEAFDSEHYNGIVTVRTKNKEKASACSLGWNGFSYLRMIPFNGVLLLVDYYGEMATYSHSGDDATLGNISAHVAPEKVVHLKGDNVPTKALSTINGKTYIGILGGILECISPSEFKEILDYQESKKTDQRPMVTHISGLAENDLYFIVDNYTACYFNGSKVIEADQGLKAQLRKKAFHRHPIRDGSMSSFANGFDEERAESLTALGYFDNNELYIGTSLGRILKWKGDTWSEIELSQSVEKIDYPVRDIVFWQDRVHFVCGFTTRDEIMQRSSGLHLYAIENEEIILANVPEAVHRFSENLDAKEGILLVSGKAGSVLYNGSEWEVLIDRDGYEEATKFRPNEARVQEKATQKAGYDELKTRIQSLGDIGDKILKEHDFPLKASIIANPYPIAYAKSGDDLSIINSETVIYIDGDYEYDGALIAEFPLLVINGDVKVKNLAVLSFMYVTGNIQVSDAIYTEREYDEVSPAIGVSLSVKGSLSAKEWLYVAINPKISGAIAVERIINFSDEYHEHVFEDTVAVKAKPSVIVNMVTAESDEVLVSQLMDEEGYYDIPEVISYLQEGKQILKE